MNYQSEFTPDSILRQHRRMQWATLAVCFGGAVAITALTMGFAMRIIADNSSDWRCTRAKSVSLTITIPGQLPYPINAFECVMQVNLLTGQERRSGPIILKGN